ncbi:hypothetical protein LB504_010309, partial [Fusarium proliferatum]
RQNFKLVILVKGARDLQSLICILSRPPFSCNKAFTRVLFIISILLFITYIYIQFSKRRANRWHLIKQGWPEKALMVSVAISVISIASIT